MGELLSILGKEDFYFAMLRTATPVLLTTLGAMTASRAGVSNIALEGTMLFAAFFGVIVSAFSHWAFDFPASVLFYFGAAFQRNPFRYCLKYLGLGRNHISIIFDYRGKRRIHFIAQFKASGFKYPLD